MILEQSAAGEWKEKGGTMGVGGLNCMAIIAKMQGLSFFPPFFFYFYFCVFVFLSEEKKLRIIELLEVAQADADADFV